MAKKPSEPKKLKLVDNPTVIEMYGDDFVGFFLKDGIFRLTFAVHRTTNDEPPKITRIVSARLVISANAAQDMYTALHNYRQHLEAEAKAAQGPSSTDTIQ